jgi:excisionase family DNA binding protein
MNDNESDDTKKRNFNDGELTFTERTAARRLGVSPMTVRRYREKGEMPFYRVGSRILLDDSCIQEFLKRRRQA